jgi:hypothetical protein
MENSILTPFLKDLAESVENKKLSCKQLQIIGEFYMKYQFQEAGEHTQEDMVKFLALGWWISENFPSPNCDIEGVD